MKKTVKYLLPSTKINMGGILVKQALPTQMVNQVDPFLLLHHGSFGFNKNAPAIQQGIGPHPHRGFTPVTFVLNGEVHHRDSRNNNQIAKKGEVQWMHAGAGITHSERPSENMVSSGEKQEIIQLWINTPASRKMKPPKYQYLPEAGMPVFYSEDKLVRNKLIAGQYEDLKGKIETESELQIIWANAEHGGSQNLNIPTKYNTMLYLTSGKIRVIGYGIVEKESLVVFDNDAETIEIIANSNAEYLILSGVPINEQVVQQGPFVMNSETQILEAMRDYQMGKMGILIEE